LAHPETVSPFVGTAPFYQKFRAPYAPGALDFIVAAYGLDKRARVLDLGCGPGTLAIPLSNAVAEVVAVDPDADMLAEGRRLAGGRRNLTWLRSAAEDISPDIAPFRVATLGQSFHWMDRDAVLRKLAFLVEDGGGLAILNPGKRRPQESWETVAAQVVTRFLGQRDRHPKANPDEPEHEPALLRSARFSVFSTREFPAMITRDVASILGHVYSASSSTQARFGDDRTAFESALREALLKHNPSGLFEERTETEVLLALKQA
jgi:ubiquinone/menaquinone biosynthesis C-methylase UbiE